MLLREGVVLGWCDVMKEVVQEWTLASKYKCKKGLLTLHSNQLFGDPTLTSGIVSRIDIWNRRLLPRGPICVFMLPCL